LTAAEFFQGKIEFMRGRGLYAQLLNSRTQHLHGGRQCGLNIYTRLNDFKDYERLHDQVWVNGATSLSAHNKFGPLAIREAYHALRERLANAGKPIVRLLYWRDFFTQLAFFRPKVFGGSLQRRFDALEWDDDEALFAAWREGRTVFPVVDAAMRQLNETGWMQNRARLIVASILSKDLHVDWRRGDRYFAKQLINYDPCVNNGNWQWSASTGADTRPIRILNLWSQQQRFHPQARYV
jgi:deoxyribodipyrimidine photo-lyase